MEKNFRIRLCSDLDYDGMVVDICWGNNTVAIFWEFPLDEFTKTIQIAKDNLLEMQGS